MTEPSCGCGLWVCRECNPSLGSDADISRGAAKVRLGWIMNGAAIKRRPRDDGDPAPATPRRPLSPIDGGEEVS